MDREQEMDDDQLAGKNAFDLFPELLAKRRAKKKPYRRVQPPQPDRAWLEAGVGEESASRSPGQAVALVVLAEEAKRSGIAAALTKMGFIADTAASADQALNKLGQVGYNLVIVGTEKALVEVHQRMCWLPSLRRRELYYIMVGPELHTLYGLEALARSANLVVNDRDLGHLEAILHQGLDDYERLFRPLLDILSTK